MISPPFNSRPFFPGQLVVKGPVLHPRWWRPGIAIFILGLIALASAEVIQSEDWWIPGVFIIVSGLLLLPEIYHVLKLGAEQIMADHLLVLAGAFIVYFVLGASLVPFGPRAEAEYALSGHSVGAPLGMRITAINCIGFGLALISGSLVGRKWVSGWTSRAIEFGKSISQEWTIVAFLVIGGASALYVLQFDIGLRPGLVSGSLRAMSMIVYVAIMVAAAHRGKGSAILFGSAIVLTLILAIVGLLILNKSSVLLPIASLIYGLAWRYGMRRVVVPGLITLIAIFLLIGNLVSTSRQMFGIGNRINWSERIDVMTKGITGPSVTSQDDEYQSWARFNYISAQGAAINFYDTGQGGSDYTRLGWVFLPRFVFYEKPIITSGREFNYKITGSDYSSNAPGIFVDGYYNLGWWGVIAVGLLAGCILAWTSALASVVFREHALLWLPMALLGSFMAFRVDGNFLSDYWAPFILLSYVTIAGGIIKKHFHI